LRARSEARYWVAGRPHHRLIRRPIRPILPAPQPVTTFVRVGNLYLELHDIYFYIFFIFCPCILYFRCFQHRSPSPLPCCPVRHGQGRVGFGAAAANPPCKSLCGASKQFFGSKTQDLDRSRANPSTPISKAIGGPHCFVLRKSQIAGANCYPAAA